MRNSSWDELFPEIIAEIQYTFSDSFTFVVKSGLDLSQIQGIPQEIFQKILECIDGKKSIRSICAQLQLPFSEKEAVTFFSQFAGLLFHIKNGATNQPDMEASIPQLPSIGLIANGPWKALLHQQLAVFGIA